MFNVVKQCRHGLMVYNRNDTYVGRSLELYGEFSPGECNLFEQIVRTGDASLGVRLFSYFLLDAPRDRIEAGSVFGPRPR